MLAIVLALGAILAISLACGGSDSKNGDLQTPAGTGNGAEAVAAPDFPSGHTWFNVPEPLSLGDLRGKAVLLDFWTLGCINCQHIVPDLTRLEEEFGDQLTVIGVHSGKYDRERDDDSIREAILRAGLQHPVVNDPDFAIWSAYGAEAWPTVVLIDPAGNVAGYHSGEGVYPVVEPAIQSVIEDFGPENIDTTPLPIDLEAQPVASAFLSFPGAVLADEVGERLFIADSGHNRVLIADLDGKLESAIGSGEQGWKDGLASEAQFFQPQGLELSEDGETLYIADTRNHRIRAVDLSTTVVTTLSGDGVRAIRLPAPGMPAETASLASPWGLQRIGDTLYVAMAGTHQIWSLGLGDGTVAVYAGTAAEGIEDGPRLQATLAQPSGITTESEAVDFPHLFWVDPESSSVRQVTLTDTAVVKTIVGRGLFDFGDVDGPPEVAKLEHPQGIAWSDGLLYIADTYNHKIKQVNPETGEVTTFAGAGEPGASDGPAATATFDEPGALAVAGRMLYIADTNSHAIRILDLDSGAVSTVALSNLGIAVSGSLGRMLRTSLPAVDVSPDAETLRISLRAPEGYHLNELAPSVLALSSSNGDAFSTSDDEVSFSVSDPSVEIEVPASVAEGQAILSATGEIYYCRDGEESICLIDRVDLALPLTVAVGGASAALLDYELPS